MKFVLDGGEQKEIRIGSALAGLAAESIEIGWRELDKFTDTSGVPHVWAYINHSLRCRLLPGAELRIVQDYGPDNE